MGMYWSRDAFSDVAGCRFVHAKDVLRTYREFERTHGLSIRLATVVSGLAGGVVLFLPAAGRFMGATYTIELGYTQLGVAVSETKHPYLYARQDAFNTSYVGGNYEGFKTRSVRLATVVSELTGVVVLFLPAAGSRNGDGFPNGPGVSGVYQTVIAANTELAYWWVFSGGSCQLGNWHRRWHQAVRLATVVSGLVGVVPACCGVPQW